MYASQLNFKDVSLKAILSGIGLYGLSGIIYGDVGTIEISGRMIPTFVPLFGAGAAASVASDLGTGYLLPMLPQENKYKNATSALLDLGISGAAGAIALKAVTDMPAGHLPQAFAIAAVTNGFVEWLYYNVISKTQQGIFI